MAPRTCLLGIGFCAAVSTASASVMTELVIAFDDSGSINSAIGNPDGPELQTILNSINGFFTSSVGQQAIIDSGGLAVGLVRFGADLSGFGPGPEVESFYGVTAALDADDLVEVTDATSANTFAAGLPTSGSFTRAGSLTSPQLGIATGNTILNASTRTGTNRFILVIGDGQQSFPDGDGGETEAARIDAVNDGITVAGFVIDDPAPSPEPAGFISGVEFYEDFVVSDPALIATVVLEDDTGFPPIIDQQAAFQSAFDNLMFDILGVVVPEPGTWAAMLGGVAGVLALARRRWLRRR